jgi:hypothetical protein
MKTNVHKLKKPVKSSKVPINKKKLIGSYIKLVHTHCQAQYKYIAVKTQLHINLNYYSHLNFVDLHSIG